MTELKQIQFTPEVLARIAPDISLKRHLTVGIRPNLRNFTEFNQIEIAPESNTLINLANKVIGSSIIKAGSTTIINTITMGIIEDEANLNQYTSIYPVIDILRGRSGAPTDEEMILSQNLYETILHTKVLPHESLKINDLGISVLEEEDVKIFYPEDREFELLNRSTNKSYSYVLLSYIKVFSKQTSTSSLNDLCYISMIEALKSTKLPRVYISDHSSGTKVAVRSRNTTKRGVVGNNSANLHIDLNEEFLSPLKLKNNIGVSSNFGIINVDSKDQSEPILLADLAGEAEESTILSKISIISDGDTLKKFSLINGDNSSDISLDMIKNSIELANFRAKELLQKTKNQFIV